MCEKKKRIFRLFEPWDTHLFLGLSLLEQRRQHWLFYVIRPAIQFAKCNRWHYFFFTILIESFVDKFSFFLEIIFFELFYAQEHLHSETLRLQMRSARWITPAWYCDKQCWEKYIFSFHPTLRCCVSPEKCTKHSHKRRQRTTS